MCKSCLGLNLGVNINCPPAKYMFHYDSLIKRVFYLIYCCTLLPTAISRSRAKFQANENLQNLIHAFVTRKPRYISSRNLGKCLYNRACNEVWQLWAIEFGHKLYPDSKVHGANMGPIWVLSAPDGPQVVPINLAIRVCISRHTSTFTHIRIAAYLYIWRATN